MVKSRNTSWPNHKKRMRASLCQGSVDGFVFLQCVFSHKHMLMCLMCNATIIIASTAKNITRNNSPQMTKEMRGVYSIRRTQINARFGNCFNSGLGLVFLFNFVLSSAPHAVTSHCCPTLKWHMATQWCLVIIWQFPTLVSNLGKNANHFPK